jgi:hypothetical protein
MEKGEFMIRQRPVTVITDTGTLTVGECGDVVCNNVSGFTLTLPAVFTNGWYQVNNMTSGAVVVSNGSTMATLNKGETLLVLAVGTSWKAFS